MSSFLFQKEQINCNCFDSSPKANRRIFRSQSYHSTSNNNKDIKEISVRNQSQQGKHKKKSLKKQKHPNQIGSQKDPKQKQQIPSNYFIPQLPINSSSNQYRKQQKVINFQNIDGQKVLNIKPQKNKASHYLRSNRPVEPFINELSITNPLITNINNSINLSGSSYPQSLQYINYKATHKYEKISSHREYQQLINKQFQQDLHQFKIHMQRKSKIQQKDKSTFDKKISLDKLINFQIKDKEQQFKNDKKNLQIIIKEKQKNQSRIKFKPRKQSLSANQNQNYQNFSLQNQEFTHRITSAIQYERTPIRPASFRGSTVSQKQKQSITKKIKGRMLPKQIQSQKDGSSSQSDQLSQVLGRGWDGLTQQRIQLQQLQHMTKRQKLNSQTMVTQQSHIKNSQIKTQTGYSNSFISPKSQNTKVFPFGGSHKYGVTGLSYHHIQQFGNHKQNYHQKKIF